MLHNKIAFFSKAGHLLMRAFSYTWSLPVTWQWWRSHHSIRPSRKLHVTCKLNGWLYVLWKQSYCRSKFYIAGI